MYYTQHHSRLFQDKDGFYKACLIIKLIDDNTCLVQFNNDKKQVVDERKLVAFEENLQDKPWEYNATTMERFFTAHDKLQKKVMQQQKEINKLKIKIARFKK